MHTLNIKDLHAKVGDKEILKGISLEIKTGEVHALMGLNGSGKSTLSNVIMGNPIYKITKGDILFDGKNIKNMSVDQRSRLGIFLAMQYPAEIKGVLNSDFLKAAINSRMPEPINLYDFIMKYENTSKEVGISEDLASRYLNYGYSGGEKKRNEILQLKLLNPHFSLIDEIDSGLDVDALKAIGNNLNNKSKEMGTLIITHYQRIFEYIKPTHVHVLKNGKIVANGGYEIIEKIDKDGYNWINEK